MNWLAIESLTDLEKAVDDSSMVQFKAVVIFKHSTRCSISSTAKFRLESKWVDDPQIPVYYLDLIKYRELSNKIAQDFLVQHESPQVLVIKDQQCIYQASHLSISAPEIVSAIKN